MEVLPREHLGAEAELRRLANELEKHPLTAGRTAWHWYPGRTEPPTHSLDPGIHLLLVDTTITLYNRRDDWLELTLDIAWLAASTLAVSAAIEVACWCSKNHNMHQVRQGRWHVANTYELTEAFAAGVAMLMAVLVSGPMEPHPWRVQAGLPDAPDTGR